MPLPSSCYCQPLAPIFSVAFSLAIALTFAAPVNGQVRKLREVRQLTGIEGLRTLQQSGKPSDVERFALTLLWDDIRQPEVLVILASAQEKLRKPEDAAAYYTLFLRALDEASGPGSPVPVPPAVMKQRPLAERRLKALKRDDATLTTALVKTAKGKKFDTPETVEDGWMNNARGDLFSLHELYAWKLVGGRKDKPADWIHNTQGAMHRSGLKLVTEAEGRKGVLFTVPLKDMNSADAGEHHRTWLQRFGHNSHVEARNLAGARFLRAGVRAYGFPLTVKVIVEGKELVSETVAVDKWSDLKVELPKSELLSKPPAAATKPTGKATKAANVPGPVEPQGQRVVMELIVPEGQKWSEGVWIDYFDFFDK